MANETPVLGYGEDYKVELTAIPAVSLLKCAQAGMTHYMGNYSARTHAVWQEKNPNATDADAAANLKSVRDAMWQRILSGDLATVQRGPSVDPVDTRIEKLAAADIRADLKAQNVKKEGKGDEAVFVFANGTKRTMDEMLTKRLALRGEQSYTVGDKTFPSYRAQAEKQLAAEAKAAAQRKTVNAGADLAD